MKKLDGIDELFTEKNRALEAIDRKFHNGHIFLTGVKMMRARAGSQQAHSPLHGHIAEIRPAQSCQDVFVRAKSAARNSSGATASAHSLNAAQKRRPSGQSIFILQAQDGEGRLAVDKASFQFKSNIQCRLALRTTSNIRPKNRRTCSSALGNRSAPNSSYQHCCTSSKVLSWMDHLLWLRMTPAPSQNLLPDAPKSKKDIAITPRTSSPASLHNACRLSKEHLVQLHHAIASADTFAQHVGCIASPCAVEHQILHFPSARLPRQAHHANGRGKVLSSWAAMQNSTPALWKSTMLWHSPITTPVRMELCSFMILGAQSCPAISLSYIHRRVTVGKPSSSESFMAEFKAGPYFVAASSKSTVQQIPVSSTISIVTVIDPFMLISMPDTARSLQLPTFIIVSGSTSSNCARAHEPTRRSRPVGASPKNILFFD